MCVKFELLFMVCILFLKCLSISKCTPFSSTSTSGNAEMQIYFKLIQSTLLPTSTRAKELNVQGLDEALREFDNFMEAALGAKEIMPQISFSQLTSKVLIMIENLEVFELKKLMEEIQKERCASSILIRTYTFMSVELGIKDNGQEEQCGEIKMGRQMKIELLYLIYYANILHHIYQTMEQDSQTEEGHVSDQELGVLVYLIQWLNQGMVPALKNKMEKEILNLHDKTLKELRNWNRKTKYKNASSSSSRIADPVTKYNQIFKKIVECNQIIQQELKNKSAIHIQIGKGAIFGRVVEKMRNEGFGRVKKVDSSPNAHLATMELANAMEQSTHLDRQQTEEEEEVEKHVIHED